MGAGGRFDIFLDSVAPTHVSFQLVATEHTDYLKASKMKLLSVIGLVSLAFVVLNYGKRA